MKSTMTKYGMMIIAAVLLVGLCAGVASAADVAPEFAASCNNVKYYDDTAKAISTKTVSNAYLIQNESNWRYVVNEVNTNYAASPYKSANLILTHDIVFTSEVDSLANQNTAELFYGKIYGNGYQFINITQPLSAAHGLVGYVTDGCELNYVRVSDSNIQSDQDDVGGLIGYAYADTVGTAGVKVLGCSVTQSNVTSTSWHVGGLIGHAKTDSPGSLKVWVNASYADRVCVEAMAQIGGLIGFTDDVQLSLEVTDSWVNGSEMVGGKSTGGLIGHAIANELITNISIKDSRIIGTSNILGGLVGYADTGTLDVDGCSVENCTLDSSADYVGGLIGQQGTTMQFIGEPSYVNYTWVKGNSGVGSVIGAGLATVTTSNPLHTMVINNTGSTLNSDSQVFDNDFDDTQPDLASAIAAGVGSAIDRNGYTAGVDFGYRGPVYEVVVSVSGSGNASASRSAYLAGETVQLTATPDAGYVLSGWTSADVPTPITGNAFTMPAKMVNVTANFAGAPSGIIITNSSGSYVLMAGMMTVYGDNPATDGTTTLTYVSGKPVLTLTNFKAANTSNVPIINASVPDLTIKLSGESNLLAGVSGSGNGAIYVAGNLTISSDSGATRKLIVNNTLTSGDTYAINAGGSISISGPATTVEAYAISTADDGYAIYAPNGDIVISGSAEVTAVSNSFCGDAILSKKNIRISSSKVLAHTIVTEVTAPGTPPNTATALATEDGDIVVSDSSEVTAIVEGGSIVYAIGSGNIDMSTIPITFHGANFTITSSKVTARATAAAGGYMACGLNALNGVIEISGTATEIHTDATALDGVGCGIMGAKGVTINGCSVIEAKGTGVDAVNQSAVGYMNGNTHDITSLQTGYAFTNITSGTESITYDDFNTGWRSLTAMIGPFNVSNYAGVRITKAVTPQPPASPQNSGSSSRHGGSTVILPVSSSPIGLETSPEEKMVPTGTSTILPTPVSPATTPSGTARSPVPFVGLMAGLGIASLVLARMRK